MEAAYLFCNIMFTFILIGPSAVIAAPEFRFSFGTVRGVDSEAIGTGDLYYSYFGIPFAAPPVGNLRFKPPVAYTGFGPGNVITSKDYPKACLQQPLPEEGSASEDCLHLNVFTPPGISAVSNPTVLKRVMVWIHGGGFTVGMTRGYTPGRLVTDHDVIVVSIQYRLGVLGFLSSGDDVLPGNLGLHDQVLALKWVKDNIRQFSGDPDDVTLFGESAGGVSVSLLGLSPYGNGLFTKAVIMSGTALAPWAVIEHPKTTFYAVAEALGCMPRFFLPWNRKIYHRYILSCLETKNATQLNWQPKNDKGVFSLEEKTTVNFAAVVDGDLLPRSPESLLRDDVYLRRHGVLDRSYVIGFTNAEGLMFAVEGFIEQLVEPINMATVIRYIVRDDFSLTPTADILNVVDFQYTFPREADGSIPYQGFVDLTSDSSFVVASIQFAKALSEKAPVYLYVFDHYPKFIGKYFSSYADLYTPESAPVPVAYRGALASFAKDRIPSYRLNPTLPTSSERNWPRYDLSQQQYLAISAKPEVRKEIFAQRVALWTDFLPRMAAKQSFFRPNGRVAYD
ncbi:carboxylic ester hydrolase [Plakobranchus ocellatus]|uniref:Carboxylic ester hydrolase n=1 Tax=Plakobranchus ocellatus TaxID=259542 RepID=A0AAV4AKU5_9GAST|nr:carboxylic ester hydrolase [Plakobranchus ocellatus]